MSYRIILEAEEVRAVLSGWPLECCLMISADAPEWDAVRPADLSDRIGLLPVWPPRLGYAVADVSAVDEISLVELVLNEPAISDQAKIRLNQPHVRDGGMSPGDIDF